MKRIIPIIILLVVVAGGAYWLSTMFSSKNPAKTVNKGAPVIIGFSLGSTLEERWLTDASLLDQRAKELGAVVNQVSANDADTQINQIKNLISQGVKVIVVVPADSEKLAPVVAEAHAAGAKVIAYDRMIKNSDLDMYISFDNVKVGQLEAQSVFSKVANGNFAYIGGSPSDNNAFLVKQGSMAVLDSKIKSGEIKLVIDKFMNNWDPTEAYQTVKAYLATGKTLDAVVSANDGMAYGVIKALQEKGLAGKVPVSGQDADLAACQRIIAGTQTATVYKPIKTLAYKAAEIAVALARGEKPETNNKVNNGKIDVLSYLLNPIIVNKDNIMATVVKDGFQSYSKIYNQPAK
jgi:D-xylose transport system substrate-binding protein